MSCGEADGFSKTRSLRKAHDGDVSRFERA
jgi:hypothetical protein